MTIDRLHTELDRLTAQMVSIEGAKSLLEKLTERERAIAFEDYCPTCGKQKSICRGDCQYDW
jgi:hypothetical protein